MVAARNPAIAGPTIQPTLNTASKIALARGTSARPTRPGHGRRVGGEPQDPQDVHREGHGEDDGERRAAEAHRDRDQRREARHRPRSAPEHHPAAVPAVGVGAGGQADDAGPGSVVSTPTTPIANPDPVSASTSSGMAVLVIESPNELMPWPNSTTRKSRLSRSRAVAAGSAASRPARGGPAPPRARSAPGSRRPRRGVRWVVVTGRGYRSRPAIAARPDKYPPGVSGGRATLGAGMHPQTETTIAPMTDEQPRATATPRRPAATAPRAPSADVKINFGAGDGAPAARRLGPVRRRDLDDRRRRATRPPSRRRPAAPTTAPRPTAAPSPRC